MLSLLKPLVLRCLLALLCFPLPMLARAQATEPAQGTLPIIAEQGTPPATAEWSAHAQHVYGLPGATAKDKGTLKIASVGLTFTGEMSNTTIPLSTILAVSAGNERVELWGLKGQILRAAMPNNAGLLAATMMHHRVDMFTVEFVGASGGYGAAVFFLSAHEADRAMKVLSALPVEYREPPANICDKTRIQTRAVLVPLPDWNHAEVPAAYRALLYEHTVEELRKSDEFARVYREGEGDARQGCPQYTVHLSVAAFRKGSQVKRASMGPVGFFVGTTQMVFDARITEEGGKTTFHTEIKATVRGESQNTKVAESIARKFVKKLVQWRKQSADAAPAGTRGA